MRLYFNVGLLALVVAVTVTFISTPDITLASEPEEPRPVAYSAKIVMTRNAMAKQIRGGARQSHMTPTNHPHAIRGPDGYKPIPTCVA